MCVHFLVVHNSISFVPRPSPSFLSLNRKLGKDLGITCFLHSSNIKMLDLAICTNALLSAFTTHSLLFSSDLHAVVSKHNMNLAVRYVSL